MKPKELEIIRFDYEKTLAFIDKLDDQIFRVKGWALVTCSAVIAYGMTRGERYVLFANCAIVIMFLFQEMAYKTFHESGIRKCLELEEIIQADLKKGAKLPTGYVFGLGHKIEPVTFHKMFGIILNPARWHSVFLYFMILVATVAAFFFCP